MRRRYLPLQIERKSLVFVALPLIALAGCGASQDAGTYTSAGITPITDTDTVSLTTAYHRHHHRARHGEPVRADRAALRSLDRKCPETPQELIYEARQILDQMPAGTTVGSIIRGVDKGVTTVRNDMCLIDFHAYRDVYGSDR